MAAALPALNLIAEPDRRRLTLDLAREIEERGFTGIQVSSSYANMTQCTGLALATKKITFATAIAPIYAETVEEFAHAAAYTHEVSGGRFQFGIGVAHGPTHVRMGVTPGKPLGDIRAFVAKYRSYDNIGTLPPIILATLRKRMIALAGEIADGMVFANGSRSHMAESLAVLPPGKRDDPKFYIGNRIRTCISNDLSEARTVVRRAMTHYTLLPYYRNYWKEAGYTREMNAVETAISEGRIGDIPKYLNDEWLEDVSLFGPASKVRDGIEAWRAAGIRNPVVVPLSPDGNQITALRQVFEAFE
ncbi:MAG TPA: LLM class flavin-dependent oxidoreductase [Stellaceae bacterium]|jgi:alkanesulfonate monooxygenase SsuD/methylene tetrahydromethanopterin reductase-like flavin-dependent oxidoreductase (luciferase family)|nr:LLM class flavin-dependent oxidoreductase [Stellaceae bacterium]